MKTFALATGLETLLFIEMHGDKGVAVGPSSQRNTMLDLAAFEAILWFVGLFGLLLRSRDALFETDLAPGERSLVAEWLAFLSPSSHAEQKDGQCKSTTEAVFNNACCEYNVHNSYGN